MIEFPGAGRAAYVDDPDGNVVELWTWDVGEHLRRVRGSLSVPAPGRTAADLAERLLAGDKRALARAISLVENDDPEGWALVREVYPKTGARGDRRLHGAARGRASRR